VQPVLLGCAGRTTVGRPWPSSLDTTTPSVISALELRALDLALEALSVPLAGATVHVHVDSRVALAALRKGSRGPHLHALATAAWRRAAALAVRPLWFMSFDSSSPSAGPTQCHAGGSLELAERRRSHGDRRKNELALEDFPKNDRVRSNELQ